MDSRYKGALMFVLMILAVYFNVFDQNWSNQLQGLFDLLKDTLNTLSATFSWLHVGTPITFLTFKWTLTAIVVNLVTILFAIADIVQRKDREGADIVVAVVLGMLIVFHIIAFPISITERFDFNSIVIFTYIVYFATDVIGMRRTRTAIGKSRRQATDYPIYYYPACCLDGPTLAVIVVFLFASTYAPITKDFYDGIGAGILLLSGFVYAGLLGFVIPERRIHIQDHKR